jgi:two-component system response regulator YesN
MLPWAEMNIEIAATARNGGQAAELIRKLRPHIVISDIKMPVKSGLDLARECAETYGKPPLFIMLTSYEEFDYVRQALKLQAVDYLIKLELTPESLKEAVLKAVDALARYGENGGGQVTHDKFFTQLYNDLFEDEESYESQRAALGIEFGAPLYAAVVCGIVGGGAENPPLRASAMRMFREALSKTYECCLTPSLPDPRRFIITCGLPGSDGAETRLKLEDTLRRSADITRSYFGAPVYAAAGVIVPNPRDLRASYVSAARLADKWGPDSPVVFAWNAAADAFAFGDVREALVRAFREYDAEVLVQAIEQITAFFEEHPDQLVGALDAASNVLYLVMDTLEDGESIAERVFAHEPDGYRKLYRLRSVGKAMDWLKRLGDECRGVLLARRQDSRRRVIAPVQEYIARNLDKRLSLNEVAAVFNFSPSYLSQLFAKHTDKGFVEYITSLRVAAAKRMLVEDSAKIYEVADRLGFENAFYFSKVFKKVEGISPTQYLRDVTGRDVRAQ